MDCVAIQANPTGTTNRSTFLVRPDLKLKNGKLEQGQVHKPGCANNLPCYAKTNSRPTERSKNCLQSQSNGGNEYEKKKCIISSHGFDVIPCAGS
jgi:hypothetical protein